MAHFAQVNDEGIVTQVLVIPDDQEHRGHDYLSTDLGLGGKWYKTSYNTHAGVHAFGGFALRKNYAGVGYTFDKGRDAFIPPKPFPSWTLDEETCTWKAPVEIPGGSGAGYTWNEETLSWDAITE